MGVMEREISLHDTLWVSSPSTVYLSPILFPSSQYELFLLVDILKALPTIHMRRNQKIIHPLDLCENEMTSKIKSPGHDLNSNPAFHGQMERENIGLGCYGRGGERISYRAASRMP